MTSFAANIVKKRGFNPTFNLNKNSCVKKEVIKMLMYILYLDGESFVLNFVKNFFC